MERNIEGITSYDFSGSPNLAVYSDNYNMHNTFQANKSELLSIFLSNPVIILSLESFMIQKKRKRDFANIPYQTIKKIEEVLKKSITILRSISLICVLLLRKDMLCTIVTISNSLKMCLIIAICFRNRSTAIEDKINQSIESNPKIPINNRYGD